MGNNSNNLGTIFNEDVFTGIFYLVYGIGDFLFGIFFLTMAIFSLIGTKSEKLVEEEHHANEMGEYTGARK